MSRLYSESVSYKRGHSTRRAHPCNSPTASLKMAKERPTATLRYLWLSLFSIVLLLGASVVIQTKESEIQSFKNAGLRQTRLESSSSSSNALVGPPRCSPQVEDICLVQHETRDDLPSLTMVAVPHTASTSATDFFHQAQGSWKNSLSICGSRSNSNLDQQQHTPKIPTWSQCSASSSSSSSAGNQRQAAPCVLWKLQVAEKQPHLPFNRFLDKPNRILFTILRHPEQLYLSHYSMRLVWDAGQYNYVYPPLAAADTTAADTLRAATVDLTNITVAEWARNAWWRQNLFTKTLATDSRSIWVHADKTKLGPTKEASDYENARGNDSDWLSLAWERVQTMPFFGLHHRMQDTFDLFGFSTCQFNNNAEGISYAREVDDELQQVVNESNKLDQILMIRAESLFDEYMADMRKKQSQGWKCDMSRLLKMEEPFGVRCI